MITDQQVDAMKLACVYLERLHSRPYLGCAPFTDAEEVNACRNLFNAFKCEGFKMMYNIYDYTAKLCESHDMGWRSEMARRCYLDAIKEPESLDNADDIGAYYSQLIVLGILLCEDAPDIDLEDYEIEEYAEEVCEYRDLLMKNFKQE